MLSGPALNQDQIGFDSISRIKNARQSARFPQALQTADCMDAFAREDYELSGLLYSTIVVASIACVTRSKTKSGTHSAFHSELPNTTHVDMHDFELRQMIRFALSRRAS